jgi:hypothetical protein
MRQHEGSITVEASVVMTVAVMMTFFLFFAGAYLYDLHQLQALSTRYAWKAWGMTAQTQTQEGRIDWDRWEQQGLLWRVTQSYDALEQQIQTALLGEQSMWFDNTCTFQVSLSSSKASITYQGVYHFPIQTGFLADGGLPFSGRVCLSETDGVEWIRLIGGVVRGFGE